MSQPSPETILAEHQMRCTRGRTAILRVFMNADGPLTEMALGEALRGEKQLNKVTIYRALAAFVKAGILHRAYTQNRVTYYELSHRCSVTQCHPHFTCVACEQTYCLTHTRVTLATNLPPGFVLQRQKVSIEGLCVNCRGKSGRTEPKK